MKYLQALNEKKLEKEQLTKKVQAKIDALEKLVDKLQEEDLDEDKIEEYKQVVVEMDEEIASEIKVFDLDKHLLQMERLEKAHNARRKSKLPKTEPQTEPKPEPKRTEQQINRPSKIEIKPEQPRFQEPEPEEVEVEEIKDFEKRSSGLRPKKSNLAYMMIGLGVLFLTAGVVQLRRK